MATDEAAGSTVPAVERRTARDVRGWMVLALFVVAVAAVAAASSLATVQAGDTYRDLKGPSWAPPAWLFGPVWTALYLMMAVAAWLAWRAGATWREAALRSFAAQLLLNGLWSPLFFALQWRGAALACILALDAVVAVTAALFWRRSRPAGLLMVPYLLWILFATVLNTAYWTLNR